MDRKSDFSEAGTTPKKAGTQQIPTGRPPTSSIHPLPEFGIPTRTLHMPITATHGRPWRTRSTLPSKTLRSRKLAGGLHHKNQALPQSALLIYMWIWHRSPHNRITSRRSHLSHAQNTMLRSTHVCQPGSKRGITMQITARWDRCRHGMDLSKQCS